MKLKIKERGYAGHFICANRCRFKRNTLIEYGEKRIVVSTVGNYWQDSKDESPSQIGFERYYETMAFEAKWEEPYWEADVSKEIRFDSEWEVNTITRESDMEADKMHEAVVKKLSVEIKKS